MEFLSTHMDRQFSNDETIIPVILKNHQRFPVERLEIAKPKLARENTEKEIKRKGKTKGEKKKGEKGSLFQSG